MQDEVGDERFLERRGEALDEVVRQPADESDRVREQRVHAAAEFEHARLGIQRREELVIRIRPGTGQRIEQRRFPCVRVPNDADRVMRPIALRHQPRFPLLNFADQLIFFSGNHIEIIVCEFAPSLLHGAFELHPLSFHLIPIHLLTLLSFCS